MPAPVRRQFGMEGQREAVGLPDRDGLAGVTRQFLNVGRSLGHLRSADEDRRAGATDGRGFDLGLEAIDLPAVRVAPNADIHQLERLLVGSPALDVASHQDHPRAGAHHRHPRRAAALDRCFEFGFHEACHRRAFASRQDQGVDCIQVWRKTNRNPLDLAGAQRRQVLAKVALQREDANAARTSQTLVWHVPRHSRGARPRTHQPLPASSSSWGIAPISNPRIALPRLLDASARMSGRSKYVVAATMALARAAGFSALKMPEPTKIPSQPSCIMSAASAGVAIPPAAKLTTGSRPRRAVSSSRSAGAPIRLASMTISSGPAPWSLRMAPVTARMWRTASTTFPVPASPLVRIIAAPSAIRRKASPRSRHPQTNGILKACLLMWCSSSAGVSTSLSSM